MGGNPTHGKCTEYTGNADCRTACAQAVNNLPPADLNSWCSPIRDRDLARRLHPCRRICGPVILILEADAAPRKVLLCSSAGGQGKKKLSFSFVGRLGRSICFLFPRSSGSRWILHSFSARSVEKSWKAGRKLPLSPQVLSSDFAHPHHHTHSHAHTRTRIGVRIAGASCPLASLPRWGFFSDHRQPQFLEVPGM